MKTTIATIVIAATIATTLSPAQAGMIGLGGAQTATETSEQLVHKTRGRAAAAALGFLAGAMIAGAAANASSRRVRICRKWLRSCNHGSERSCWKYDTKCR